MGEASGRERRAVAQGVALALGDEVAPESHAFWQYFFVLSELGEEAAQALVREVHAVEAAGGMTTQDGSRRRTPGGVFFTLAYERLGPKRTRSVRWRATRRTQEDLLRRFLQILSLGRPVVITEPAAIPPGEAPAPAAKPAAPTTKASAKRATPPADPAARPARRQETETVEVLVVRRRPAGESPAAKPVPPTPRAGK